MTASEVWFTHHLAGNAVEAADAGDALARSRRWLQDVERGVGKERRRAFFEQHPLHARILAA